MVTQVLRGKIPPEDCSRRILSPALASWWIVVPGRTRVHPLNWIGAVTSTLSHLFRGRVSIAKSKDFPFCHFLTVAFPGAREELVAEPLPAA